MSGEGVSNPTDTSGIIASLEELLSKAVVSIEEEGYIKIKALKFNVATGRLVVVKKAE